MKYQFNLVFFDWRWDICKSLRVCELLEGLDMQLAVEDRDAEFGSGNITEKISMWLYTWGDQSPPFERS